MKTPSRLVGAVGVALAVSTFGCSEAVPFASQAALSAQFRQVDSSTNCAAGFPLVAIGGINKTDKPTFIEDGVGGAEISCGVIDVGGRYDVGAELKTYRKTPDPANPNDKSKVKWDVDTIFTMGISGLGDSSTMQNPASGEVTIRNDQTKNVYTGTSCKFWLDKEGGGRGEVQPGAVRVTFECPQVLLGGGSSTCKIETTDDPLEKNGDYSVVALQNCAL